MSWINQAKQQSVAFKLSGSGVWSDAALWASDSTSANTSPDNVAVANVGGPPVHFYDVVLDTPGVVTLADERTVDSVTIKSGAALHIDPLGSLSVVVSTELNDGGTLQITSDSSLASGGHFVFDGGVLKSVADASTDWSILMKIGGADFDVANDKTLTLQGNISSDADGDLLKHGDGTLVLAGNNTYSHGTIIYGGKLIASGGSAIPDGSVIQILPGGLFELADDETINNVQGAGDIDLRDNTLTIRNTSPASPLTGLIYGAGGVTIDSISGVVWFANDHTYSGLTTVNNLLVLGGVNSQSETGSIRGNAAVNGALWVYRSTDLSLTSDITGSGFLRQLGDSTLLLGGQNTIANVAVGGRNSINNSYSTNSTIQVLGSGKLGASNVNVSVERGGHLDLGGTTQTAGMVAVFDGGTISNGSLAAVFFNFFAGSIGADLRGAGYLRKVGSGEVSLSGANTYSGPTDVLEGLLRVRGGGGIGDLSAVSLFAGGGITFDDSEVIGSLAGGGDGGEGAPGSAGGGFVQLAAGKTLVTGGNGSNTTFGGIISGDGGLTKQGAGIFTLSGFGSFTGPLTVAQGTLAVNGTGQVIGDATAVTVASGATYSLLSSEAIGSLSGSGVLDLSPGILFTGRNGASTVWSGTTRGIGGLSKEGSGLFSTRSLGHTGVTQVTAGELKTNGSIAGDLFVAPGALFSGNANVAGAVANYGTIAPGNSYGGQIFAGNYAAGPAASMTIEAWLEQPLLAINGTTHDFVSILGNASGKTLVNIVAGPQVDLRTIARGLPQSISLRGKEIVRVQGSASRDSFVLAAPVLRRGFQYLLDYVRDYRGTTDGFFLRAHPRNEVLSAAAAISTSQALVGACLQAPRLTGDHSKDFLSLSFSQDVLASDVDEGTKTRRSLDCTANAGGFSDFRNFTIGFFSSAGAAEGDTLFPTIAKHLSGEMSLLQTIVTSHQAGFDFRVTAGYASGDWATGSAWAKTEGLVATANIARQFDLEPAKLTFSWGLRYDNIACSEGCLAAGTLNETSLVTAHAEARAAASFANGLARPYAVARYTDAVSGVSRVWLEDASVDAATNQNQLDLQIGIDATISDGTSLGAAVAYNQALSGDSDFLNFAISGRATW